MKRPMVKQYLAQLSLNVIQLIAPSSNCAVSINVLQSHSLGVTTVCPQMAVVVFPPVCFPRGGPTRVHALKSMTSSRYFYFIFLLIVLISQFLFQLHGRLLIGQFTSLMSSEGVISNDGTMYVLGCRSSASSLFASLTSLPLYLQCTIQLFSLRNEMRK